MTTNGWRYPIAIENPEKKMDWGILWWSGLDNLCALFFHSCDNPFLIQAHPKMLCICTSIILTLSLLHERHFTVLDTVWASLVPRPGYEAMFGLDHEMQATLTR